MLEQGILQMLQLQFIMFSPSSNIGMFDKHHCFGLYVSHLDDKVVEEV